MERYVWDPKSWQLVRMPDDVEEGDGLKWLELHRKSLRLPEHMEEFLTKVVEDGEG